MIASELMVGYGVVDRYMARRGQKSKSPELFDNEGNARWITIGAEPGADGKNHGGHPVKISGDGKMLTGKFAGQTLGQAFGKKQNTSENVNPHSGTRLETDEEIIQDYKRRNEEIENSIKKVAPRPLAELLTDIRKKGQELENNRDSQEYDQAYREFHQQVRLAQRSLKPEDEQLLSKVFHDWFPTPIDYEEDTVVDLDQWKKENPEPRVINSRESQKSDPTPPSDGITRVSADQLGDGSNGTYDRMHAGLASEFVQSRIAKGMEGIENREYGIFQHSSGKWQMVSRPKQQTATIESKPTNQPPSSLDNPEEDFPASTGGSESAAAAFDKAIASGGTPREAAKSAQKKLDEDYIYARASEIGNAGEDLKGSARHKVNAWRGLEQAEKDGTAAELMTRKNLLKIEPHQLSATIKVETALSHLAAHLAISAFPDQPGGYPDHYARYKMRNGSPVPEATSPEKLRQQYFDAYMAIKSKAEQLAKDDHDPRTVLLGIRSEVARQINLCRGLPGDAKGTETFNAKDPYNPVANSLVKLHNRCAGHGRKSTDIITKVMEASNLAKKQLGGTPGAEHLEFIKDGTLGVLEGKSFSSAFGAESGKAGTTKRFNPSDAYVKHASRAGGRDLSKITASPQTAVKHMVDEIGLRGVQWGNSVSDDERKHHAAKVVEAITDLAEVIGVHPKDFSLDGKLGLAIGARGKGNASAHYEPGTQVINLTRASGVGALAHEWGHAFDHMLSEFKVGRSGGDYMSEDYVSTHEINDSSGRTWKATEFDEPRAGWSKKERPKAAIRRAYQAWGKASDSYRKRLKQYLSEQVRNKSMSAKKANEYWGSSREIFARTFERHVQHKLESEGRSNTYLSGLGGNHPLWPTKEEAAAMAPAFDAIFESYRREKYGSAEKVKFSRLAAMQELMATWGFGPMIERYGRKPPKPSPGQMSFDDQDGGRWITIGSEQGADGGKHGGHPVYIGKDGEMKTGKFAGKTLGEAFGGGKSKSLHEMSQEELANHINSQKGNSLSHSWEEDWGNTMRGQGKRVKGMVRGGMASVPQGKKTYTSIIGKLEGEERREAGLLETHEQHAYVKAREAGIPHEHAMTWAWEHSGDPDFNGLTLKDIKESTGGGKSPEQTTGPESKSPESNRPEDHAYFKGDKGRRTGKKQMLHGGEFEELEMLEGPHKGQVKLIPTKTQSDKNVEQNRREHAEMQEGFSRLNQSRKDGKFPVANTQSGEGTDRNKAIQYALDFIGRAGHVQTAAQAEQQAQNAWFNMPNALKKLFSGHKEFGVAVGKAFQGKELIEPSEKSKESLGQLNQTSEELASKHWKEQMGLLGLNFDMPKEVQDSLNELASRMKQGGVSEWVIDTRVGLETKKLLTPKFLALLDFQSSENPIPETSLKQLDTDRKLKQGRFHALQDELQPLNERAFQLEQAVKEAASKKVGKNGDAWTAANRDYQKLNKQLQALNAKRKPLLDSWTQLQDEANASHQAYNRKRDAIEPTPKQPAPGLSMDTRSNEAAKPNDQMGLFGDVANVPRGVKPLSSGGESKGKQKSLFDTKGDPDQMLMFDDGVIPDDRVMKFGQSGSIRDRAAELVRYWKVSAK